MATYASDHRSSPPAESQIDELHEFVDQNPGFRFGIGDNDCDTLPIACQLAPELLRHIFLHVAPTEEDVDTDSRDSRKDILHTCQRWRSVALHYPVLWSFIVDKEPSWMSFMIHRSQPAHISLHLTRSSLTDEMDRIVCDALSQTSRLLSLTIANRRVTDMARWTTHLNPYAPNLRTLSLMLAQSEGTGVVFIPPDHFLSQGAPQLCTLVLRRCGLPSSLEPLKRLMVFRWLGRPPRSLYPSPSVLLTALEQMTGLVHLELSMSLVGMDETTFSHEIAFPRMQSMKVGGVKLLMQCSGLLKHLAIPRSASLEIRCTKGYTPTVLLPRRLSATQPLSEELHTVSILKYNSSQLHIDGSFGHADSTIHPTPSDTSTAPSLSFAVNFLWNPIAHAALESLPVHQAKDVNLCLQAPHFYSDLAALFDPFPLAECITVNEHTATDLLNYLQEDPFLDIVHTTLNPPPTTGRLPVLKHIMFSGVTVACPGGDSLSMMSVYITAFVEVLSHRARNGIALPNVVFRNPIGFTKGMSNLFQTAAVRCQIAGGLGRCDSQCIREGPEERAGTALVMSIA
ncbi:hypothetical protein BKA70DRAFT_1406776 [Coprinopsis sp. MPI-PUGE-AT-0042]|nr:hypothetical protein BKA70DRAFT_1406776 [Coprinopsis sp. MPI-PUGE-AT-0042]